MLGGWSAWARSVYPDTDRNRSLTPQVCRQTLDPVWNEEQFLLMALVPLVSGFIMTLDLGSLGAKDDDCPYEKKS